MNFSLRCFLTFLFLVLSFPPLGLAQESLTTLLKKGVVKVTAQSATHKQTGTGFVVARGKKHIYIVTAYHVISFQDGEHEDDRLRAESIQVTFFTHQEEALTAKVVRAEREQGNRGLVLLKVGGDLPEGIRVLEWDSMVRLQGGERVDLIGFPRIGGNDWFVSTGTIAGFDGGILNFTGAVEEGNSGGPIFYQGKVVGVVVEVLRQIGRARPAQIAQFTVENWPGYPKNVVANQKPMDPPTSKDPVMGSDRPNILTSQMATLMISSIPSHAQVFIDDELVGETTQTPFILKDLEPDEYDLMVSKAGYQPWFTTVNVMPGDVKEFRVSLEKGSSVMQITGVWRNPMNPNISYILKQTGQTVTMSEITTSFLGTVVTAEGQGQILNNQLFLRYTTALGTMGESQAMLSPDGQQLVGTYKDFSTNIPLALSLVRTGDDPAAFGIQGSHPGNPMQNFGQ